MNFIWTFFIFIQMKIEKLYELFRSSTGVGTDTRKDLQNRIYFALKGANFNGNQYALQALERGASYAVLDEMPLKENGRLIQVENVLETLQNLATHHRRTLRTRILAITGSNGKTTNKELIRNVLSTKFNVYATKGNLNNHIGVPLSLMELKKEHDIAIIEMGANKLGDIAELCAIAEPDLGYITNIGIAHVEGFGSEENILLGKGELFEYIKERKGTFFINESELRLIEYTSGYQNLEIGKLESEGRKIELLRTSPNIEVKVSNGNVEHFVNSYLYGLHNFENIKMALTIGNSLGVSIESISKGIKDYQPENNRSQVIKYKGIDLFLDAYNANPSSMKASIKSFDAVEGSDKILVLGDMLELGEESIRYHQEIVDLISNSRWKKIYLIGDNFTKCNFEELPGVKSYQSRKDADDHINFDMNCTLQILVKGSRGQALEKLQFIQELLRLAAG